MKKRCLLTLIVFLLLLSGCSGRNKSFPHVSFSETPHNMANAQFWVQEDCFLYTSDGFYNPACYLYLDGESHRLFRDSDFRDQQPYENQRIETLPVDNKIYFQLYTEKTSSIYCYDLSSGSSRHIKTFPSFYLLDYWGVLDHYLIYLEDPDGSDSLPGALCAYDLDSGAIWEICADAEAFGIIDSKLHYATYNETICLYQYNFTDETSELLNQIPDIPSDLYYYFTEDYFIALDRSGSLMVHNIAENKTFVYPLSFHIERFIPYDQYAYATDYSTPTLYRIHLSTGDCSKIATEADCIGDFCVASDDLLYITERTERFLGQVNSTVCKIDPIEGTKTEVFTY